MAAQRKTSTSTVLDTLALNSAAALRDRHKPFPPRWDPADTDHPNPIVMAKLPPMKKPDNASSPLLEATHRDGRSYTIWISTPLLRRLINAGAEEGEPCSIMRGEKVPWTDERGVERSVWEWVVTTPNNPTGSRGGRVITMEEARRLLPAEDGGPQAVEIEAELVPDPRLYDDGTDSPPLDAGEDGTDIPF